MTSEKTSKSAWITQMRTYRLWPYDTPRTARKPCREYRLVVIDLHIKRRNSIGWRWWFLFVARYNISSFIKRLNFSNCAEWARNAVEHCHDRVKCATDFLAKTQFTEAVIWRIWTLAEMLLADILPYHLNRSVLILISSCLMAGFFASRYLSDNLTHSISHGISISSTSVYQLE